MTYAVMWKVEIDLVEAILKEQTALHNPRPLAERIIYDLFERGDRVPPTHRSSLLQVKEE